MYKIIILELFIEEVKTKTRTIKKKRFIKIKEVNNVNIADLSKKVIELKSKYKDFKYIIDFERQ